MKDYIINIDLGTYNSRVAIIDNHLPVLIKSTEGCENIPSIISFNDNGKLILGLNALEQSYNRPDLSITNIKNQLGTEVEKFDKYTPTYTLATFLQYLKYEAERSVGQQINKAIISVPDSFDDEKRQDIKTACKMINLELKAIINDSEAILTAHGFNNISGLQFMICDFGYNFDIYMGEVNSDKIKILTKKTIPAIGERLTMEIVEYLLKCIKTQFCMDLSNDSIAMSRIIKASEEAKRTLSFNKKVNINIPFLFCDSAGPKHLETVLTLEQFERMTYALTEDITDLIKNAIDESAFSDYKVILSGCSTYTPSIRDVIYNQTGKDFYCDINPSDCVAIGAAVYSYRFTDTVESSDVFFNLSKSIMCNN